jgi:hypothetical protein
MESLFKECFRSWLQGQKLMVDKPWEEGAIKVIRKAQVVVPIYFHARNSWLFYFSFKISGFHCKITIRSF